MESSEQGSREQDLRSEDLQPGEPQPEKSEQAQVDAVSTESVKADPAGPEQVQENPSTKASTIESPLEQSTPEQSAESSAVPVAESFTGRTKEIFSSFTEQSKGLFGKIAEGISSSETVQNLVDRVKMWNSEKHAEASRNYVTYLTQQQEQAKQGRVDAQTSAEKIDGDLTQLRIVMKEIDGKIDPKDEAKVMKEIDMHKEWQEKSALREQQLALKVADEKEQLAAYETRVLHSKEKIAGRLDFKMSLHQATIEHHQRREGEIETDLSEIRGRFEEFQGQIQQVENYIRGVSSEEAKKIAEKALGDLKNKQRKVAEAQEILQSKLAREAEKRSQVEQTKQALQTKKDELLLSRDKRQSAQDEEQPQARELGKFNVEEDLKVQVENGKIVLVEPSGERAELSKDGLYAENDTGDTLLVPLDKVTNVNLRNFALFSPDAMRDFELPQELIDALGPVWDSRPEAEKRQVKAREFVAGWNAEARKDKLPYSVNYSKDDATRFLSSAEEAKAYLGRLLARKILTETGGDDAALVAPIRKRIDAYSRKIFNGGRS